MDSAAPNTPEVDLQIFKGVAEIITSPQFNLANSEFFELNASKFEEDADENKHEYMQLFE